MNLYIRLIWLLLSYYLYLNKNQSFIKQWYRVWPHDLAFRGHLPNYRVFSFFELGRLQFWLSARKHKNKYGKLINFRHSRLIAAQQCFYIRPLSPFQKFRSDTMLVSWDKKYVYFRHELKALHDGHWQIVAVGLVKEAFVSTHGVISPSEILGDANNDASTWLQSWNDIQQSLRKPVN